jgi:hypothetical protein
MVHAEKFVTTISRALWRDLADMPGSPGAGSWKRGGTGSGVRNGSGQ